MTSALMVFLLAAGATPQGSSGLKLHVEFVQRSTGTGQSQTVVSTQPAVYRQVRHATRARTTVTFDATVVAAPDGAAVRYQLKGPAQLQVSVDEQDDFMTREEWEGRLLAADERQDHVKDTGSGATLQQFELSIEGNQASFSASGTMPVVSWTSGRRYATNPETGNVEWIPYPEDTAKAEHAFGFACDASSSPCRVVREGDTLYITAVLQEQDSAGTIPLTTRAELSARLGEPKLEIAIEGSHCSCGGGPVTLKARTSLQGTFLPFELSFQGSAPRVLVNRGGAVPTLTVEGDAKLTGRVEVTAVFRRRDGQLARSAPWRLGFCEIETPQLFGRDSIGARDVLVGGSVGLGSAMVEFQFQARAWLNGDERSQDLRWQDARAADGWFSVAGSPGPRPTFRAPRMPNENAAFGHRSFSAQLLEEGCSCTSPPLPVRIFFPRDGRHNPEGQKMPNWAFYWGQTSASDGKPWTFVEQIPAPPGGVVNQGEVARWEPSLDKTFISAALMTEGCRKRRDGSTDEGIDCFAVSLRHEHHHESELTAWWGKRLVDHCAGCSKDWDGDLVPTSVEEASKGCDPGGPLAIAGATKRVVFNGLDPRQNPKAAFPSKYSCPQRPFPDTLDVELNAYDAGWLWPQGRADREDWACPGKQCPARPGGP